jgi:hypothetical protein
MKLYRKQREIVPARFELLCDIVKTVVQGENHVAGKDDIKPENDNFNTPNPSGQ